MSAYVRVLFFESFVALDGRTQWADRGHPAEFMRRTLELLVAGGRSPSAEFDAGPEVELDTWSSQRRRGRCGWIEFEGLGRIELADGECKFEGGGPW